MENLTFQDKLYILTNLFITKELRKDWDSKKWGMEGMACKRLINKYPEFSFFYNLIELQDKFGSLLGLLNKRNVDLLDKKYKDFMIEFSSKRQYNIDNPSI